MSTSPQPAIQIAHLAKAYQLYERHSDRLREALHPFRKKYHKAFFALKDVSFHVFGGEALGILGRNGSGKSTLLKIITGVLTPSSGHVDVRGRISAILELGAGFNPELTGLENIYFNGTIQGREREETERMVPDILAFADIGEYIHQPVKTYSSGMFARLAFALAVNVNPDILIVDEALSVGDMRFQQKCLRKMRDFRDQGKTILFVTHSTAMVTAFCDRALWLDGGEVREIGPAEGVCKRYTAFMTYGDEGSEPAKATPGGAPNSSSSGKDIMWQDLSGCETFGDGGALITQAALLDATTSEPTALVKPGQQLLLPMRVRITRDVSEIGFGLLAKNRLGQSLFTINTYYADQVIPLADLPETITVTFALRFPHLTNGQYSLSLAAAAGTLFTHQQLHWVHDAISLELIGDTPAHAADCLIVLPRSDWSIDIGTTDMQGTA